MSALSLPQPGRLKLFNGVNFIGFQCIWFCCVLGAAAGNTLPAYLIGSVLVLLHLGLSPYRRSDLVLLLSAISLGGLIDSTLMWLGILVFEQYQGLIVPPWLLYLWAAFSLTINHSMSWLKGRYLLASLLGAVSGSLSYLAGARLGAVVLPNTTIALLALAAIWAIITPTLLLFSSLSLKQTATP